MGWKTINGRRYFYRMQKEQGRVKSTYFGPGSAGAVMAEWVALERQERAAERERLREEREQSLAEERIIADWFDDVQIMVDAALVATGYRKHRGEWRRRRR
jgi:hypothetical protein